MDITENDKFQMARMMLNHANAIVMHSGNIINWFTLKKGVNPKSSEEVCLLFHYYFKFSVKIFLQLQGNATSLSVSLDIPECY